MTHESFRYLDSDNRFRLETTIHPETAEALKRLRVVRGLSNTELVRQSVGLYNLSLTTEFEGGEMVSVDKGKKITHIDAPRELEQILDEDIRLPFSVNVHEEVVSALRTTEAIEGTPVPYLVDRGIVFQSRLVDIARAGSRIFLHNNDDTFNQLTLYPPIPNLDQ